MYYNITHSLPKLHATIHPFSSIIWSLTTLLPHLNPLPFIIKCPWSQTPGLPPLSLTPLYHPMPQIPYAQATTHVPHSPSSSDAPDPWCPGYPRCLSLPFIIQCPRPLMHRLPPLSPTPLHHPMLQIPDALATTPVPHSPSSSNAPDPWCPGYHPCHPLPFIIQCLRSLMPGYNHCHPLPFIIQCPKSPMTRLKPLSPLPFIIKCPRSLMPRLPPLSSSSVYPAHSSSSSTE